MGTIERKLLKENDLTIFTISGSLNYKEIIAAIKEISPSEHTTNNLWDLSRADFENVKEANMRKIIGVSKEIAPLRESGKTAIVTPTDLGYGLSRMYEILAEAKGSPISYRAFRNLQDARNWLDQP